MLFGRLVDRSVGWLVGRHLSSAVFSLVRFWFLVRFGFICFRSVWVVVRSGSVRFGSVRLDSVGFGSVPFETVRDRSVPFGSVWFGSVLFRSVRFGVVWFGLAWVWFVCFFVRMMFSGWLFDWPIHCLIVVPIFLLFCVVPLLLR